MPKKKKRKFEKMPHSTQCFFLTELSAFLNVVDNTNVRGMLDVRIELIMRTVLEFAVYFLTLWIMPHLVLYLF